MRWQLIAAMLLLFLSTATPAPALPGYCRKNPALCSSPSPSPTPAGEWTLVFDDEFSVDYVKGTWPEANGTNWTAYPCCWSTLGGVYDSHRVNYVSGGYLHYDLHAENGTWYMANPSPILPGGQYQTYGRYALRWQVTATPGYYWVPLLWPNVNDYLTYGEIDWPEGNLTSTNMAGFIHHTNASGPGDQKQCLTGVAMASGWHATVTEWRPGSVKLFLDGALVCEETVRTPTTPMRWQLQNTTSPQGLPPAGTTGEILVDYARVWSYTP